VQRFAQPDRGAPPRRRTLPFVFEIILIIVFFSGLVIGGLVGDARGWLPSAEALQEEDRARFRKLEDEA